jgi:uncharacterized FAD-dependent dehydrogenase
MKENKKIVIIGAGVAGINAATKLVDNGYPGELITIIDKGKDPYLRPPSEVMLGFAGAGLFSDGKYVYLSNTIGGHLTKYCGEEKSQQLVDEGLEILKRFHPDPSKIMYSAPIKEPEFIKPYFNLRLAPTYHIGTNYLHEMGKKWFDYLVEKGINFCWECEVRDINFNEKHVRFCFTNTIDQVEVNIGFDKLIYCTGKSGIDLTQKLINKYDLKKESKSVQLGVRMELPQHYVQKLVDVSYDFKLYQKPNDKVSIRTFCTNNNAAYVAEEETYGMKSYNGHSFKQEDLINNMTNFGIIMEIKGIENPFEFQKRIVSYCQRENKGIGEGLYYSPNKKRKPSLSAEGNKLNVYELEDLEAFNCYGEYAGYIVDFISDLDKIFKFGDDYGIYIPEVKFLSEEVLVNYNNLSLIDYPNISFCGDSLSARGIAVSAAQGLLIGESILKEELSK